MQHTFMHKKKRKERKVKKKRELETFVSYKALRTFTVTGNKLED